jgi:calcineurin-like phosphoesterase family protein
MTWISGLQLIITLVIVAFWRRRLRGIALPNRFTDVTELDELMIENWNARVKKCDRIYHLGDLSWYGKAKTQGIVDRLNGSKFLIRGNHDSSKMKLDGFQFIKDYYMLKHDDQEVFLFHRPCRSWDKSSHGAWHLYGHRHGNSQPWGKSFDVGVDCWDFCPINWETVKAVMAKLADTKGHHEDPIWLGSDMLKSNEPEETATQE